jgi:hypothetical protein
MINLKYAPYISAAAASLLVGAPAVAQAIIAPTSAVINSGGPGDGDINDTFNQVGLNIGYTSGVTNFDSYVATNPIHSVTFSPGEWFSNNGSTSATVTYDFGSSVGIDRLALWNEEASGIGVLSLLSSIDGLTFTALGQYAPVGSNLGPYGVQVFSFGAVAARYVRFDMSDCPQAGGTYPSCAIGEVAFRSAVVNGAVPEPASWAMMIAGVGIAGGALRRRRSVKTTVSFA